MAQKRVSSIVIMLVISSFLSSSAESVVYRSKPTVSYSGRFVNSSFLRNENGITSQNGIFQVVPQRKRQVNGVVVSSVNISRGESHIYSVDNVYNIPQVSNSGILMTQGKPERAGAMPSLACYDNSGKKVISKVYSKPVELYGFLKNGKHYGIGSSESLDIMDCESGTIASYEKGYSYTVSDNGEIVVIASRKSEKSAVTIYKNKKVVGSLTLGSLAIREMDISVNNKLLAVVDRDAFTLIDLAKLKIVKKHTVDQKNRITFVDVMFGENQIWVGQQKRNADHSEFKGILRSYNIDGTLKATDDGLRKSKVRKKLNRVYQKDEYPWPFEPQNESHIVWNGYLAVTGSSNSNSSAYLHQGLDIDVPANEPTLSVSNGFCKARLYIMDPSYLYWRVCIADEDVSTQTEGWMYAHLVENTITVSVDDEVVVGQELGDIIKWDALSNGWDERGHIHFSRISDHGSTWSYTDDQWKNVCDPLMLLRPFGDTIAPVFLDAGNGSSFKFCTNEGSGYKRYLDPAGLSGEVDVVIKMTDEAGTSKWWQPASRIYWWIKSDGNDKIVHPRTIGLIKNQTMPYYTGTLYSSTLPPVMHSLDNECMMHSSWTTPERNYYHIVTNSDGDSSVEESDKYEALNTADFGDGDYWIFVEIQDVAGNVAVDSQLVYFDNGIVNISNNIKNLTKNGLVSVTKVPNSRQVILNYNTTKSSNVLFTVYSLDGKVLFESNRSTSGIGSNKLTWSGKSNCGRVIAKGSYIVKLKIDKSAYSQKLVL